jgi:hypothetical protein
MMAVQQYDSQPLMSKREIKRVLKKLYASYDAALDWHDWKAADRVQERLRFWNFALKDVEERLYRLRHDEQVASFDRQINYNAQRRLA